MVLVNQSKLANYHIVVHHVELRFARESVKKLLSGTLAFRGCGLVFFLNGLESFTRPFDITYEEQAISERGTRHWQG